MHIIVCRLLVVLLFLMKGGILNSAETQGVWLKTGKDPANTSRSDVKGKMINAPKEIWKYGSRKLNPCCVDRIEINGQEAYLILNNNRRLELIRPDGKRIWEQPVIGVYWVMGILPSKHGLRILVSQMRDTLLLIEASTGKELWKWQVPKGADAIFGWKLQELKDAHRLFVFPQGGTEGYCFEFKPIKPEPELVWRQDYADKFLRNYGPAVVLADMDNDGKEEVVIASKPAYVGVIDSDTGAVKFDIKYKIAGDPTTAAGRPYGLFQAVDLDGNGFKDIVMVACKVEEYIAVLRNEGGKSFKLVWAQFVEKDFPEDHRGLCADITSVADVNGDGKQELVVGLYNMTGDMRWHTLVFDPFASFDKPLADFEDRYFHGCFDINGDKQAEILVSKECQRRCAGRSTLEAIKGGTGRVIGLVEDAAVSPFVRKNVVDFGPLPGPIAMLAECRILLRVPCGKNGYGFLVSVGESGKQKAWQVRNSKSVLEPAEISRLSEALLSSLPAKTGVPLDLRIQNMDDSLSHAVSTPLVSCSNKRRELIVSRDDGVVEGGVPDLSGSRGFKSRWTVPGTMPAVWIGDNGHRILCAVDPVEDIVMLYELGSEGKVLSASVIINLPEQILRRDNFTNLCTPWPALVPFSQGKHFRLLVPMRTGEHTMVCAVYDEKGKLLWIDRERGPFPCPPAVGDLHGDGKALVVCDHHGMQIIYDEHGNGRVCAQAWHNTVPGRSDGSAHAMPIIGPFGPQGQTRILMSPGLSALEILDPDGNRLLKRDYHPTYATFGRARSAVARMRGTNQWDMSMISDDGMFHCVDLADLTTRWTVDLGCRLLSLSKAPVAAGDVDGDGRDEFLVGLPDGSLVALTGTKEDHLLWRKKLDAGINDIVIADVDGDAKAEIVLALDDGSVRILE